LNIREYNGLANRRLTEAFVVLQQNEPMSQRPVERFIVLRTFH